MQYYALDSPQEVGDTAILEFRKGKGKKEPFISNIVKDSLLYRNSPNEAASWTGFKKDNTIALVYTFYKMVKVLKGETYFSKNGGDRGTSIYKQFFNTTRPSFTSPDAMTNPLDTVIWYNVKYVYKRK
ncbi:hypothetical protein KTO58_11810 [Chitinophaga pendula]|uniref:hypothetical protein n=1 Tax=Chitinophaga TaxID=79328 RepID=UPI0012FD51C5|nr:MULTISPECIES: hypothetical protein [Chitinophaga]UCJ09848.1 hypothetical protein KTO58_11810 [Chitinophaga pendula]